MDPSPHRPRAGPVAALADLLLSRGCAGCAAPGGLLCDLCAAALDRPVAACRPRGGCPRVWAAAPHGGPARSALLAYKAHRARALSVPLGLMLARAVTRVPGYGGAVLVPVPGRTAHRRARGYDPVALLAAEAARALAGPYGPGHVPNLLRYRHTSGRQVGLDRESRRANVTGTLEVRARALALVRGRPALLVDDVITTGATLGEAVRALRDTGVPVVGAAVLTERR